MGTESCVQVDIMDVEDRMIKAGLAKALTLKVGLAVGAAVAAGGLAVAASTGALPNLLAGKPSHSTENDAHGSPSPSLHGLCNAFSHGNKSEHGKALESPAFQALITAAGGKEKVEGFCADLLKATPEPKESEEAEHESEQGDGKPSAKPNHPTAQPSHPAH
jgi:hypothetical protein